ncbi:hypothetical protein [Catellicoccus marimammalium]|uniref:hypothetical protein n=1 Tax=Catellicoccus marimammalium TaxID=300419 RepID=UPI00058BC05A|nr:hypothetical protein [Catellicoccus marimammalium]
MVDEIIAAILFFAICIFILLILRYIGLIVSDTLQYFIVYVFGGKDKSAEEKERAHKKFVQTLKNDIWYVFLLPHKPKFLDKKRSNQEQEEKKK